MTTKTVEEERDIRGCSEPCITCMTSCRFNPTEDERYEAAKEARELDGAFGYHPHPSDPPEPIGGSRVL